MAKLGRNDPCYCGSGKKYKHCHLREDHEREHAGMETAAVRQTVGTKLWQFGTDRRFMQDLVAAAELYWNGPVDPAHLMEADEIHRLRLMDYFLHDHLMAETRERIIDLFAKANRGRLSRAEERVLAAWQPAYLSVYEVIGVDSDGLLRLEDIFQETEVSVRLGLPDLEYWPLLYGRLVTGSHPAYFIRGLAFPIPLEFKDELKDNMGSRFHAYQARNYGGKWPDFLRELGYLVNHFIVERLLPDLIPESKVETPAGVEVSDEVREIVQQMQSAIITGTLDQHYARWAETPIAAWGGKTPREMVWTDEGRDRVEAVLDELEDLERAKAATGQPSYNVDRLRMLLGLIEPVHTGGGVLVG